MRSIGISSRPLAAAAVAASLALAACGEESQPRAEAPPSIAIKDFKYAPASLTVKAGTTVRIANRDDDQHTLTAADAFDSRTIAPKATGAVSFKTAGTFAYICQFHPFMKGTVTVTA